jgi:hypothetical protein
MSSKTPLKWGSEDFWEITGQKAFQWDNRIINPPNPGDSWCICMWATASLIERVGCDNVHLRCDSTDVDFVLNSCALLLLDQASPAVRAAPHSCLAADDPQLTSSRFSLADHDGGVRLDAAHACLKRKCDPNRKKSDL